MMIADSGEEKKMAGSKEIVGGAAIATAGMIDRDLYERTRL